MAEPPAPAVTSPPAATPPAATPPAATPGAAAAAAAPAAPASASEPEFKRKGGQWGLTVGAAICVPGRAACSRNDASNGAHTIDGTTGPSLGTGFEIGFRFSKYIFSGLGYDFGMFDTAYERSDGGHYVRGMQHGVYLELRPILPIGRIDVGMSVAPGISHQVFTLRNGDKDYAQGFSFKLGPTIDVFVGHQVFLGAKLDLMLNAHSRACRTVDGEDSCASPAGHDVVPVHQMVFGLHVGTTFL